MLNSSCGNEKEVVIVQPALPHYRLPFYEILRRLLEEDGVRLRVIYSPPGKVFGHGERMNALYSKLQWGEEVSSQLLPFGFVRQPIMRRIRSADLVIVSDGTRYILNYAPYLLPMFKKPKIAFWGHGWNHQTEMPKSWSERTKFWLGNRVDWYFAYTWYVRERLISRGYDENRITDVQNAVDGPATAINHDDVERMREELGLGRDMQVAFFCSKMYPMKELRLLIAAAVKAHEKLRSFRLVLAGAGSDQGIAEEAARMHQFVHYIGPVLDKRRAALYALSRLVVMPGLVGLGAVEAFHYGVPPVATKFPYHSPEFVYLRDNVNSLIVDRTPESLSAAMIRLATDDALHARLVAGCQNMAKTLTVEEMARRFAEGIRRALEI